MFELMPKKSSGVTAARRLSPKAMREVLKSPWTQDAALSGPAIGDARVLEDGRVVLWSGDKLPGIIYPSRESLANMMAKANAEAARGPRDMALELLPPIDDFLRDVAEHTASAASVLRVPAATLDGSAASLVALDKAFMRVKRPRRWTREVHTVVVAYVGTVIAELCRGRWTKPPRTRKRAVETYAPADLARKKAAQLVALEKQQAAKERGATGLELYLAYQYAMRDQGFGLDQPGLTPITVEYVDEPYGLQTEPMVRAVDGELYRPWAYVFDVEISGRVPIDSRVRTTLALKYWPAEWKP